MYFPLLFLRRKVGWPRTLVLVLSINLMWLSLTETVPLAWQRGWLLAAPAYWFSWALGALAVEAWVGLVVLPQWTQSLGIALCMLACALFVPSALKSLVITTSFFFVLRFAVENDRKRIRPPTWLMPGLWLGQISYSVYLIHNPAYIVAKRMLLPFGLPLELVLILRFLSGITAGYILYRLVEKRYLSQTPRSRLPSNEGNSA